VTQVKTRWFWVGLWAVWQLFLGAPEVSAFSSAASMARSPAKALKRLPYCRGWVVGAFHMASMMPPPEGSDAYVPPSPEILSAMRASVTALLDGRAEDAWSEALVGGYVLCRGRHRDRDVALWRPTLSGTGQPVFAVRTRNARPIVFEAPHPITDAGTPEQGMRLFRELNARALIVSGTHRCANLLLAGCDGATSICGNVMSPYRESDMAHVEQSIFQVAHEAISDWFSSDWVVSLHGMGARGVSFSDGTALTTTSTSPVALLTKAFEQVFPEELVTSCNAWTGAAVNEHLCGTNNVQGRHLNGVGHSACTVTATRSSNRFIHIEQSLFVRERWSRVAEAIDQVLPLGD
jgi:hypothetical protein